MPGRFGQWLQSIGNAFIAAGQSVAEAFRSVFSTSETITGVQPDAAGLRSALENEQLTQIALTQPDAQGVQDWIKNRGPEAPADVFAKIPHSQIRQSDWALDTPYQVRMHFGKFDDQGNLIADKWVTLWEGRNKSPGELMDDADAYWATAGEKYGYDKQVFEYEIWEDPFHPDWTP